MPIIGNLWVDYGARCSFLLADWTSTTNYAHSYVSPYATGTYGSNYTGNVTDTLFVPEIYTGLDLRWTHAELGAKFEVQRWQSDRNYYTFESPTVVGLGMTLTARF